MAHKVVSFRPSDEDLSLLGALREAHPGLSQTELVRRALREACLQAEAGDVDKAPSVVDSVDSGPESVAFDLDLD